jgi:hypothetical protein
MLDKFIKYKVKEFLNRAEEKQYLGEGLTMTHSLDYTVNYIQKFMGNIYTVKVYKDFKTIIVYFIYRDTNHDKLFKFMNNMGYFISAYYLDDGTFTTKVGKNDIISSVRFEPKFDLRTFDIDDYLYHVTEKVNLPKILKIGLTPKTKSKIGYHPERIYLAKNLDAANEIMGLFLGGDFIKEPVMLRIKTKDLKNVFLMDTQFEGGVYTHENIPPSSIEVLNQQN